MAAESRDGWSDRYGQEPRKGCDILVQALEREDVRTVFAYPGGCSMEIHQALTRSPIIRNILCRHEQASPLIFTLLKVLPDTKPHTSCDTSSKAENKIKAAEGLAIDSVNNSCVAG